MQNFIAVVFLLALASLLYSVTVAPVLERANENVEKSIDQFTIGFPE